MKLEGRLDKLEARLGPKQDRIVVFKYIAHGHREPLTKELCSALVVGVGRIFRRENEAEDEFARRAYAMVVSGKHVDDMSDEELLGYLSAADKRIALEFAKTGKVSDELLHEAAGTDVVEGV